MNSRISLAALALLFLASAGCKDSGKPADIQPDKEKAAPEDPDAGARLAAALQEAEDKAVEALAKEYPVRVRRDETKPGRPVVAQA